MEEEEGGHQSGISLLISGATRARDAPPVLSPSSINICRAYHGEHFLNPSFYRDAS
jgi:hypothetical protein